MNCGSPSNNIQALMCNVINNATQIFTNAQLITFDSMTESEQYQAESIIQCSVNMLLMNIGYNAQYGYSSTAYYVAIQETGSAQQMMMTYVNGGRRHGY